jgi:predicted transcriptional regulator
MSSEFLSCRDDECIEFVATRMFCSDTELLPVIDENKKIIGSITSFDICLAPHKIKKPKEKILVSEVMNSRAVAVNTHDDQAQALLMLRMNRVKSLPVVDNENTLRGTVSFVAIARKIVYFKNELKTFSRRNTKQ